MADLIETARQALWTCIDQSDELADSATETGRAFIRTIRGDNSDDGLVLQQTLDPSLGEIPAMAIRLGRMAAAWDQNQSQKWDLRFGLMLWTIDWHQPRATALFEKVIRAFWKYTTTTGGSIDNHIKLQTGYYPREYGLERLDFVTLGDSGQVTRIEGFVSLRSTKNPFVE